MIAQVFPALSDLNVRNCTLSHRYMTWGHQRGPSRDRKD